MININLGIDSAMYQDDNRINLNRYATEIGKIIRPLFPQLTFRFSAVEADNADTMIQFNDDSIEYSRLADDIREAIQNAEGVVYPDKTVWN